MSVCVSDLGFLLCLGRQVTRQVRASAGRDQSLSTGFVQIDLVCRHGRGSSGEGTPTGSRRHREIGRLAQLLLQVNLRLDGGVAVGNVSWLTAFSG